MSTQKLTSPEKIESELLRIWEGLSKQKKNRASLFNLIVFNRLSSRTDYIRSIVQKVVEKFPCRILFITQDHETDPTLSYLKTAVSVIAPQTEETSTACDHIDIGVAGTDLERVPFLLLPHLIPDLPVYLLWTEDPSQAHPLFSPLLELAHRVIFDSESADSLLVFAQTVLALKKEKGIDIADLNWARTKGWRDLLCSTFNHRERMQELEELTHLEITYNARESAFFCHLKIQAMYLLNWLSSRLQWTFQKATPQLQFTFQSPKQPLSVSIQNASWKQLGPGTILSLRLQTATDHHFDCLRLQELPHQATIQISSKVKCELPYHFIFGQTATGQSLVSEITTQGTSSHYLDMLQHILLTNQDRLC